MQLATCPFDSHHSISPASISDPSRAPRLTQLTPSATPAICNTEAAIDVLYNGGTTRFIAQTTPTRADADPITALMVESPTRIHGLICNAFLIQSSDPRASEEYACALCELIAQDLRRTHATVIDFFRPTIHLKDQHYASYFDCATQLFSTVISVEITQGRIVSESMVRLMQPGTESAGSLALRGIAIKGQTPQDRWRMDALALQQLNEYLRTPSLADKLALGRPKSTRFADFTCAASVAVWEHTRITLFFSDSAPRNSALRVLNSLQTHLLQANTDRASLQRQDRSAAAKHIHITSAVSPLSEDRAYSICGCKSGLFDLQLTLQRDDAAARELIDLYFHTICGFFHGN